MILAVALACAEPDDPAPLDTAASEDGGRDRPEHSTSDSGDSGWVFTYTYGDGATQPPPLGGPGDSDGDGWEGLKDCNDSDPLIHPGAEEIWYDGVDQDCDGNDMDQDFDGFDLDDDCDDLDPLLQPWGPPQCGSGIDANCDGLDDCIRKGAYALEHADLRIVGTVDIATGDMVESADLNGDGFLDLSSQYLGGEGYHTIWYGPFSEGVLTTDDADLFRVGHVDWGAWPLDVDLDGLADVFYPFTDGLDFSPEGIELWQGPFEGAITEDRRVWTLDLAWEYDLSQYEVGDLDGDGDNDLIVSTVQDTPVRESSLDLVPGPLVGHVDETAYTSTITTLGGYENLFYDAQDNPPHLADFTGDGALDVYARTEQEDEALGTRGYVLAGPLVGVYDLVDDGLSVSDWDGCDDGQAWGSPGDLNGDGYADATWYSVLREGVDAPCEPAGGWEENLSGVLVEYGPMTLEKPFDARVTFFEEEGDLDNNSVGILTETGDHDGDGNDDLVYKHSCNQIQCLDLTPVQVVLAYGPFTGTVDAMDEGAWFYESPAEQGYPNDTGGVGDLNGDGLDEIVIWDPVALNEAGETVGTIFVFFGAER